MLFAQINPQAIIANLEGPFELQTSYAEYMTAIASPYRLGDNQVTFSIYYGNFTYDNDQPVGFDVKLTNSCVLSGPAIDNWGTDDSEVLNAIALEQGTAVTQFIENDIVVGP
jgi:hypothetical protein